MTGFLPKEREAGMRGMIRSSVLGTLQVTHAIRALRHGSLGVSRGEMRALLVILGSIGYCSSAGKALAACTVVTGSTYECSGPETTSQTVTANNAAVSTVPGFSVTVNGPSALTISGAGAISYSDNNASALTQTGLGVGTGLFVTSTGNDGALPGSVRITTDGTITAGGLGISAMNQGGGGSVVVIASGAVTATAAGGIGINAENTAGIGLGVDAGAVTGGNIGISARNGGGGMTIVTAADAVVGTNGMGILAFASGSTGTGLAVDAAAVGGGVSGILARNEGGGMTAVRASGKVEGYRADSTGLGAYAINSAGTGLIVDTAAVSGGFMGIDAQNSGGGDTQVTATGLVEGRSPNGHGIVATNNPLVFDINGSLVSVSGQNTNPANNVTVTASGGVTGGLTGVLAYNGGTGELQVNTRGGAVSGAARDGIVALNSNQSNTPTNVSVVSDAVSGGRHGIVALNAGTGSTTVEAFGAVSGGAGGYGIVAANGQFDAVKVINTGNVTSSGTAGTDVTVTAHGNVSGGAGGILVQNRSTGATSVTTHGTVTSTSGEGMRVIGGGAVDVQVDGTVTGTRGLLLAGGSSSVANISVTGTGGFVGTSGDAVYIQNNGVGAVTVNISGAITSTGGYGVNITDSGGNPGNINLTTGAVTALSAGMAGIVVAGSSGVTIVTNGDVRGADFGIVGAVNPTLSTGTLSVTANGAVSGNTAVSAQNYGTGATIVTTVGPVTAAGTGIYAVSAGGGAVSVTTGQVTATGNTAIFAFQVAGAGTTEVTSSGAVSGTTGIDATNGGTGAVRVIAHGAVTGTSAEGIKATGNGAVDVQIAGTVMGATRGLSVQGATGTIAVSASGAIRNLSGLASDAALQAGGGSFALSNAGTVVGTVSFGGAGNTFNNSGTWNTAGGTSTFGGAGDVMTNLAGGTINAAGNGAVATTTLDTLGSFVNQGRVTLVNGMPGDVLKINGNARFESGSVYALDIGGAGSSDRILVSGSAQLAGTLAITAAAGTQVAVGTRYTVLTADGGISGRWDTIQGTAFLGLTANYDASNSYLEMTLVQPRPFVAAALTPNQIGTASALDSIAKNGALFSAVSLLPNDIAARHAFDQLSGEGHATAKTVLIDDSRFVRDAATGRIRAAFGAVAASRAPVLASADPASGGVMTGYASLDLTTTASLTGAGMAVPATTERFALWGQAFGAWGHTGSDGNAQRLSRSTGGFLIGGDAPVFETWRLGLMAGYGRTNFNVRERASSGASDNYHLGLYGGTQWGDLGFRAGAAYTWHDFSTSRGVAFAGFSDSLKGSYRAGTAQVFGEFGYGVRVGNVGFEPFANLAYVNLSTGGFTEQGGAAALRSRSTSTDVTFTTLGLRASSDFAVGGMSATVRGMLGWRHAFGDTTPFSIFNFAGSSPFTIAGIPIARNALAVDVGLDVAIAKNAVLGIAYGGQFGSRAIDQSIRGNLAVRF